MFNNQIQNNITIHSASTLFCEAAAEALKSGMIVDLGPLGKLYPTVNGKWSKTEEEQTKAGLTTSVNYRPSDDIFAAVRGASLKWVGAKDGDDENDDQPIEADPGNPTHNPDEG